MSFPQGEWEAREGLAALLEALGARDGETRYVGGAVRDTLRGLAVSDLDLATRLAPAAAAERIRAAGFKAVPTGIAHGTVTAVLPSGPVEVTTLRRDVATDGRRAEVAFTDDWREDAARRDFTINALSADPVSRALHDYFGGAEDLAAGRVRFIGEPLRRIAEDHLRILRFFRFQARFGSGAPDPASFDACRARANDLMALSRERIADELLKILKGPRRSDTIALMVDAGILRPVLPEIATAARLRQLDIDEATSGVAPDPIRALAALLPADAAVAEAVAARLRLSKLASRRLALAANGQAGAAQAIAYHVGLDAAIDRLLLDGRSAELDVLAEWTKPRLGVSGGDLIARGLAPGPIVAATLQAIERRWIAEGFPDAARLADLVEDELAQARARQ